MYERTGSKKAKLGRVLKYHSKEKVRKYRIVSTLGLCVNNRVGKTIFICVCLYVREVPLNFLVSLVDYRKGN